MQDDEIVGPILNQLHTSFIAVDRLEYGKNSKPAPEAWCLEVRSRRSEFHRAGDIHVCPHPDHRAVFDSFLSRRHGFCVKAGARSEPSVNRACVP
jgi:hypothetical protein